MGIFIMPASLKRTLNLRRRRIIVASIKVDIGRGRLWLARRNATTTAFTILISFCGEINIPMIYEDLALWAI